MPTIPQRQFDPNMFTPPPSDGAIELEDGSGLFELEDGSGVILLEG